MSTRLEALKKKKARLMRKAGIKDASIAARKQREAEERKLLAEIYALEHPRSAKGKEQLKATSKRLGKFISRNASLVARNAEKIAKAKKEAARKERLELAKINRTSGRKRKAVKKRMTRSKSKPIDYGW